MGIVCPMKNVMDSVMELNDFPKYSDGDVLVMIAPDQQYQLHSTVLRPNSDYFRKVLTTENAAPLSAKSRKQGVVIKWRLELQLPEENENSRFGWFVQRELDANGKPKSAMPDRLIGINPFSLTSRGKDRPKLYKHYDNMLRAYFHKPPKLDYTSFAATLSDAVELADIAEHLGSIACVSNAIDLALVVQGQVLYRSIASNAAAWAALATRTHSFTLFCESVVHLVGQWNRIKPDALAAMDPQLREVCEKKANDLEQRKTAIELRILGHYPVSLQVMQPGTHNVGAGSRTIRGKGHPTRAASAYGANIMSWMALSLFRHWLGQSIANDMSRRADDGGLAFYRAIAAAGDAYINQASREAFAEHFPLSAKARTRFDEGLTGIKDSVKSYVAELMVRRCLLDLEQYPVQWLTCAEVTREDAPWSTEEDAARSWENVGLRPGEKPAPKEQVNIVDEDTDSEDENGGGRFSGNAFAMKSSNRKSAVKSSGDGLRKGAHEESDTEIEKRSLVDSERYPAQRSRKRARGESEEQSGEDEADSDDDMGVSSSRGRDKGKRPATAAMVSEDEDEGEDDLDSDE